MTVVFFCFFHFVIYKYCLFQGVYQGYAGQPQPQPQPQPGAMPNTSPSGTPGSASPNPSNPYARGSGSGYGGSYPKPSQGYPTTPQGYK